MSDHLRGLLYAVGGVLILSPDALLVRLVEADHWSLLFWRYLFFSAAVVLGIALFSPGGLRGLRKSFGWPLLFASLSYAFTSVTFVIAITHTLAANALFAVSAAPLFGALVSWLVLGERLLRRTWLAILVCSVGLMVIFSGSLGGGSIVGDLAGLGTAIGLAINANMVRHYRQVNMLLALAFGGLIAALVGGLLGDPASVAAVDFPWLLLQGSLVLGLSFVMITLAPRYIPAPEVNMIMLLESFLGPLWVWWFLAEVPPNTTLLGGALVISTLVLYTASKWAMKPAPATG